MVQFNTYTSADIADELKKISRSVGNHPILQAKIDHYQQRSGPVRLINSWGPYQFTASMFSAFNIPLNLVADVLAPVAENLNYQVGRMLHLDSEYGSTLYLQESFLLGYIILAPVNDVFPFVRAEFIFNVAENHFLDSDQLVEAFYNASQNIYVQNANRPIFPEVCVPQISCLHKDEGYWRKDLTEGQRLFCIFGAEVNEIYLGTSDASGNHVVGVYASKGADYEH
jgi:hypothetical protein